MNEISPFHLPFLFEKLVAEIFASYGFEIALPPYTHHTGYIQFDISAKLNGTNYWIEVKFSRTRDVSISYLLGVARRIKKLAAQREHEQNSSAVLVLVIGAKLTPELREKIKETDIVVIDIQNLLFLVQDNEQLKSDLLSILDFSVNDLLPVEPPIELKESTSHFHTEPDDQPEKQEDEDPGNLLKKCLSKWKQSNGDTVYENLCFDVLKYLFNDELALWHKQQRSNANLYRFDLICKIKDGEVSGLWSAILQFFNSKYIVFEFKNYSKKITQKEIYTTDKYLYLKALRGVAILISCKGSNANADKAIRGTLRENGKLILSVSNQDLIKMIDIKMGKEIPANYLYSMLDDLLISLEK